MSEFNSVSSAIAYLDSLGSSDAIASELHGRKIRSKPGCPEGCAIADYISESVGTYSVTVDGDEAIGFYGMRVEGEYQIPEGPYRVSLPHVVHTFVIDFDCGRFPSLIATSWRGVLDDQSDAEEVNP